MKALICSLKFLLPEVALYLHESTVRSCMEYCCRIWADAPSCYSEFKDSYENGNVGFWSFTCCLFWTLGSSSSKFSQLKFFLSRYYFGRCLSELAQLVPVSYSRGKCTRYSDKLHEFSVTIPRFCEDVYVNSFFLRTARLWYCLPIAYRMLSFDLWSKWL